jgi:translation initiation factor 2-alpha kinase 4
MASNITNYSEIQHDEIEVLRSIYMDDFAEKEAKTGAWNRTTDRAFQIILRSTVIDAEDGRKMILGISFPPTYPKTIPRLSLETGPDLNPKSRFEAEQILRTKPKTLVGSEMIFEIATALQEILDSAGGINSKDVPTLDEERAVRERAARESAQQAEEEKRKQALRQQAEEEKMLQDLVKQREINLTRRENKSTTELHTASIEGNVPGRVVFERLSSATKSPTGRAVVVNAIHERTAYRRGPINTVFTVQPFRQSGGKNNDETPPFLVLKECHVSTSNGNESSMKRAIQNLESSLDFHTSLSPHQSIMKPLNYQIQKHFHTEKPSAWTVSILMELAARQSLRNTLEIVDNLDIKAIRAWSIRLIEGLQHYHRHGYGHASLHLSNILLEMSDTEQGERKTTIAKLADGGFERDLHLLKCGRSPQIVPIPWTAPETVGQDDEPLPATDIWDFGVCFLQMAFGLAVTQQQSPFSLIESLKLTKSLRALLSQIFQVDPKKRPSAWDLLHFEFFRNDDALLEGDQREEAMSGSNSFLKTAELQRFHPRRESYSAPPSRYAKEFVEEGRLGRGGFGEVFRARNKIDGQPYAIKKIKASSRSALDPVLSEVTVLSRLNHPNVVRYFASWIDDEIMDQGPDDLDPSEDDMYSSGTNDGRRSVLPASSRGLDFISSSNADVVFAYNDDSEASSADEEEVDSFSSSNGNREEEGSKSEGRGSIFAANAEPIAWTVLYIQMEYCKQEVIPLSHTPCYHKRAEKRKSSHSLFSHLELYRKQTYGLYFC